MTRTLTKMDKMARPVARHSDLARVEETDTGHAPPEIEPLPAITPGKSIPLTNQNILGLQRTLGNQAVQRLLVQRRSNAVAEPPANPKPKARVVSALGRLTRKLEKAVRQANGKTDHKTIGGIKNIGAELIKKDINYFINLIIYKLEKHKNDEKYQVYGGSFPGTYSLDVFKAAWEKKSAATVIITSAQAWTQDSEFCKEKALQDPAFFMKNFILTGLRGNDNGKRAIETMIHEKTFLNDLSEAAPVQYAAMVDKIPLLKLVSQVKDKVDAKQAGGQVVSQTKVINMLFDAFIKNKGMEVAYTGTKIDDNTVILTGLTKKDEVEREKQKSIITDMPPKLSTACHQLLDLFQSVLKSYPGLEGLDLKPGNEASAVLTEPLSSLPGGLISNSYGGNVFTEDGKPTGQIFFSGDRQKISNSHSWIVIDDVPYDPVLGTKGDGVEGAINGKFEFNNGETEATEIGGKRRLTKITDGLAKPSGAHNINVAWKLTVDS